MNEQAAGFLLLDKPEGISSHDSLYPIKRLYRKHKVGFAGTLDPAASGLLLVGIGRATRLLQYLESLPKIYRFDIKLGQSTDTYDAEGQIVEELPVPEIDSDLLEKKLQAYRGQIEQMPPVYSAIKIRGQRACDRVRRGESVTLTPRQVHVYDLRLESRENDTLTLQLVCSKGTYVRSIAHDLGRDLGCGGHARHIRRLGIGPFDVSEALTHPLEERPAELIAMSKALPHLPLLMIAREKQAALMQGNSLPARHFHPVHTDGLETADSPVARVMLREREEMARAASPLCRLVNNEGVLLALGERSPEGMVHPKKVIAL